MSEIAIHAEHLSKSYQIAHSMARSSYKTLQEELVRMVKRPFRHGGDDPTRETFWALKDVSFDVHHGEVLGIIGRNGAGKSTLLKILSRITKPSSGYADVYGRVGSLLEVGTGFHPELTGRENVFLNGAVLGMTRRDIQRRFDAIVAFAEVEQFLDVPVKRYSSGMYTRLAFSVAAHLEPDILVVDEVLAVGDAAFQKKCLGKMSDVAKEGRTVLFVSHNMASLESLCTRGLLLQSGAILDDGDIHQIVHRYTDDVLRGLTDTLLVDRTDRKGNGSIQLQSIYLENPAGERMEFASSGEDCVFCFDYKCSRPARNVSIAFAVFGQSGQPLFRNSTEVLNGDYETIPASGTFKCRVPRLPIIGGEYSIGYLVMVAGDHADYLDDAARFTVIDGDFYNTGRIERHSPFLVSYNWQINEKEEKYDPSATNEALSY